MTDFEVERREYTRTAAAWGAAKDKLLKARGQEEYSAAQEELNKATEAFNNAKDKLSAAVWSGVNVGNRR